MSIYQNLVGLIGNTPLLELSNTVGAYHLSSRLIAKLEYFNPAGSVKDRIAKAEEIAKSTPMFQDAL